MVCGNHCINEKDYNHLLLYRIVLWVAINREGIFNLRREREKSPKPSWKFIRSINNEKNARQNNFPLREFHNILNHYFLEM
jgi:hypothetical protein